MAALTDEDLERMAMEEILKESKRNAERAKEFGSLGWQNPGKSTNKRFLRNMLVSTLRNPLQKSRFNNERQSGDSERTGGWKRRRHSQEERQRNDSDRHSQEDRWRNSNERYSKSYRDRNKNSSGSSMNSYRKNNLREPYDPPSGDFRRFSYEELQQRKYEKEGRYRTKHRANGGESGESSFQRQGSPEEIGDIYHEDYMEYIQNYKKHMNYYEKMEECMQEKYARSYHSEEGGILENEARVKEQESSSTKREKLKMAQKIKKKRTWSGSSEYSGSDFSEHEKNCKSRNHSLSPTRKKKSKHMRKGFKKNYSKTKKENNSEVNNRGDSGDVNSPEVTVSVGDEHDGETISECADVLKGNNSESSDTKSSQKEKQLQKKKSKHKKHKHKKHKKDKEGSYR